MIVVNTNMDESKAGLRMRGSHLTVKVLIGVHPTQRGWTTTSRIKTSFH